MSDDLDDSNLDLEDTSFDEFGSKKSQTLGDLWRENSLVKIAVVAVGAVAIFGAIMIFGGDKQQLDPSYVPSGSDVAAPPGADKASPAYVAAVEEENEARVEEAYREGTSALPTPIDPLQGRLTVPEEQTETEDPLQRWRQLQEERMQRELQQAQIVQPAPVADDTSQTEAMQAMAESMSQQMQAILDSRSQMKVQSKAITSPTYLDDLEQQQIQEALANAPPAGPDTLVENILMPAAEIVYAQLLTEANTDAPGPVLAQIVSGPLAGSRILGTFEEQNELLTLNFNTVVVDEKSLPVSAVALDPDTTLPGMATEVDHRYLKRIVLPMAAAFVEGAASAISESGLTTVTIQGETVAEESEETDTEQEVASGIEEAGQELREILDDMQDEVQIMVRIAAGTPIGILFLEPVVDTEQ